MTRICAAVVVLLLSSVSAFATDLKIKDSRGTEVVVTNAVVDYGGFMADTESQGIRLLQGDGVVIVKWAEIESLTVVKTDTSAKLVKVAELEIVMRNGKKVPASLFRQGLMKVRGKTDLGDYAIDLDKVRTITPVR